MSVRLQERLVLCNMDAALQKNQGQLLSCDKWAIQLFEGAGGQLAFITGKPVHEVLHQFQGEIPANSLIACNGAVIYDCQSKQEVRSACVYEQEGKVAIQDILLHFPNMGVEIVGQGGSLFVVRGNQYIHKSLRSCGARYQFRPLDEVPTGWLQVMLKGSEEETERLREHARRKYYGARNCIRPLDANTCVLLAKAACAEQAFEDLCVMKGILPTNCVLLTDDERDLPVAEKAGTMVCSFDAPQGVQDASSKNTLCPLYGGGVGEYLYGMVREYSEQG